MTTSGTYSYNPALGEITLYAYNLIGVRNTAVLQEHMESARMASNMLLARWSNQGVNLWQVDKVTVPLAQDVAVTGASGTGTIATLTFYNIDTPVYTVGTTITVSGMNPSGYDGSYIVVSSAPGSVSFASTETGAFVSGGIIQGNNNVSTFSVNPNTVVLLDAYVSTTGPGPIIDRIILPISRTEYASYPNKEQAGFPTVFWFDRLLSPTVTLWPVPNVSTGPQTFTYYRVIRIQDAGLTGGQTVDIPYLWLEAFAYGLAERLAIIWSPDKLQILSPMAADAYAIASQQNVETAQQYITPMISGYFR